MSDPKDLNRIQSEVMGYYAFGQSCTDISSRMGLSEHTVQLVIYSATKALGAKHPTQAAAILAKQQLSENSE